MYFNKNKSCPWEKENTKKKWWIQKVVYFGKVNRLSKKERKQKPWMYIIMCCLTTGIHSEKCIFKQFCHCENIIELIYTNVVYQHCTQGPSLTKTLYCGTWLCMCLSVCMYVSCFILFLINFSLYQPYLSRENMSYLIDL